MIIIIVQGGNGSFQKILLASVIVLEADKCMVITEQLFQFFRGAADTAVRIFAVLGIATVTGMKNHDIQLLTSFFPNENCVIFL